MDLLEAAQARSVEAVAVLQEVVVERRPNPPGPRPARRRQEQPPAFEPVDGPTLPNNVPQVQPSVRKRPTRVEVDGLDVTWTQLRGPIGVTLVAPETPADGVATVTATFVSGGEYLFRVQASDGPEQVTRELAITVR